MTATIRWSIGIIILIGIAIGIALFIKHGTPPVTLPETTSTASSTTTQSQTYGMNQYVDSAYGFSFWYPSTFQVTSEATQNDTDFPGGTAVETLQVGSMGGTSIIVVNSPTSTITDEPPGHASPIPQTAYSYDSTSKQWMVSFPEGTITGSRSSAPTVADISKTTMSGSVMLPSGRRFDTTIIPLSITRFLVVGDGGGSAFTEELAQTIAPVGASVDVSAQTAALQAESAAYGNENGCNTDSDCTNGSSCLTEGPIIAGQTDHKVCVPQGQAVPL